MCFHSLVCIFFYETMHITYNGWYKYFWMLNILKSPAIGRHVENVLGHTFFCWTQKLIFWTKIFWVQLARNKWALTCDLVDSDVISLVTIWIPGIALDAVGGARLKGSEGHIGLRRVESDLRVWALHGHDQAIQHSVVHWIPLYHNDVTAGWAGNQIWGYQHCKQRKT